ncbi:MAG: hypothetical protein U0704_03495 [Candidatus Eisenbacteria bacterium]
MDRPALDLRLKFLLAFAAWATLTFLPAWLVSHGWQGAIAAVAGRIVAPPGSEIEFVDLELFYPMDVAAFVALCLASGWEPWPRRLRALALGAPLMVVAELVALAAAMGALMAAGAGGESQQASAMRLADGLIRGTGLAIAAALWFLLLGRGVLEFARTGARVAAAGSPARRS